MATTITRVKTTISQRPQTKQPATPHWKAPYWTRKSPLELCLKPATDMIALCSSGRVPHSIVILYPTILWSPVLTTCPLRATLVRSCGNPPPLPTWPPGYLEAGLCGTSRHASSTAADIGPPLEDPILGKQRICMIAATLFCNNSHKPLLKLQKSLPLHLVPVRLKVPPHLQTVLEAWQDHTIIK
jgi:hypothetical protein